MLLSLIFEIEITLLLQLVETQINVQIMIMDTI